MAEATAKLEGNHLPQPGEPEVLESEQAFGWLQAVRIALVALAAIAARLHLFEPIPNVSLPGLAGILVGAWPVFQEAAENALARRMTMELSMSIAIVAAAAI